MRAVGRRGAHRIPGESGALPGIGASCVARKRTVLLAGVHFLVSRHRFPTHAPRARDAVIPLAPARLMLMTRWQRGGSTMAQTTTGNGGGFLGHVQQMLNTHPAKPTYDRGLLLECIRACLDCAQACVACADACLGESDPRKLTACIRLNNDCADICETTAKILSRQTALDRNVIRAIIEACATICRSCGEECDMHAAAMQHCRVCAEACHACEQACQKVLAA
jgi:hypothetical protein